MISKCARASRSATARSFIPEDCNLQDWGVTWDEIEPYYDQFEEIFGVGGKAGNLNGEIQPGGNPHEGPRSREYPNPPTQRTYDGELFAEAVSSLGYVPFQGPTAAMTQDYRNLYRVQMLECARGGFCSSHVCAQGAKANPLTSVLPALTRQPNFELRPLCNVLRVNTDSTGKKATGVTYIDARGNEVEQPADIVDPGRLLLQQHAAAAAVGHRHALRSAHRQRGGRPQLRLPARRLGAGVLRGSRVQSVHRRRPDQHVDRRIQRRRDRPRPARLHRRRLCQHLDERRDADQGQAGAARHAALGGRMEEGRRPLLPPKHVDPHSRILPELSAQLPRSGPDLQRRLRPAAAAHDVRLERQRAAHDEVPERARVSRSAGRSTVRAWAARTRARISGSPDTRARTMSGAP